MTLLLLRRQSQPHHFPNVSFSVVFCFFLSILETFKSSLFSLFLFLLFSSSYFSLLPFFSLSLLPSKKKNLKLLGIAGEEWQECTHVKHYLERRERDGVRKKLPRIWQERGQRRREKKKERERERRKEKEKEKKERRENLDIIGGRTIDTALTSCISFNIKTPSKFIPPLFSSFS